jgi:hypothetical protein
VNRRHYPTQASLFPELPSTVDLGGDSRRLYGNSRRTIMTLSRVHFSSAKQNWETPAGIYSDLNDEFGFDFDPCPPHPTFDGLEIEWGKRNFVNPPYNRIKDWIAKGYAEHLKKKLCVFLIPSRTDTRWWHDYVMKANEIRFIKGRLKFQGAKNSAPFPSCVVIF